MLVYLNYILSIKYNLYSSSYVNDINQRHPINPFLLSMDRTCDYDGKSPVIRLHNRAKMNGS